MVGLATRKSAVMNAAPRYRYLGVHTSCWSCMTVLKPAYSSYPVDSQRILLAAAMRLWVLPSSWKKDFTPSAPHGVSGVVIIAESHLTVHTWPEHGYAAVDVFSCGRA